MKKYLFIFLAFLLAQPSFAQSSVRESQKALLWKISGKNMKKPSYLFGTIHLLCPEDYLWTNTMKKSLAACSQVCFEMDMSDPSVMMQIAVGMVDNSGKKLRDYFTEDQYNIVSAFIRDSLHMDISIFQQMKPAALLSLYSAAALNCPTPASYEVNILEEARKAHKAVVGLEEPSEQLALFDSMQPDSVVADLVAMSKDYSKERKEYARLLSAYKKQDLPKLYELINSSKEQGDNLEGFLGERNRKWIERMTDRMEQQAVFFAVGAGHLLGEDGVIRLLRKEGYTVEAMP